MKSINVYKKLKEKFGHIVLLTMSNRKDRQTAIFDQLKNLGGGGNDEAFRIQYATTFPYNDLIMNSFNESERGKLNHPNEYDCARNHYTIIKTAYDLGYEHILVMEDDIRFLKDANIFNMYIKKIPNDYDILRFGAFTLEPYIEKYLLGDEFWFKHKDALVWNTSMYALSRRGMIYYLACMDTLLSMADVPLYVAPLQEGIINTYLCKTPLVIQAGNKDIHSDIIDDTNDPIDYYKENVYEKYTNKDDYFEYKIN